jgi:hypothetical protein
METGRLVKSSFFKEHMSPRLHLKLHLISALCHVLRSAVRVAPI